MKRLLSNILVSLALVGMTGACWAKNLCSSDCQCGHNEVKKEVPSTNE
jgi:hypothetical protein